MEGRSDRVVAQFLKKIKGGIEHDYQQEASMISGGIFGGGQTAPAPTPGITPSAPTTPPAPAHTPAPQPAPGIGANGATGEINLNMDLNKLFEGLPEATRQALATAITGRLGEPSTLSQILPHIPSWIQGIDGLFGKWASWMLGDKAMDLQDKKDERAYLRDTKLIEYKEGLDAKLFPYLEQQQADRTALTRDKMSLDSQTRLALADKEYAHRERIRATDDLERRFSGSRSDYSYGSPFAAG